MSSRYPKSKLSDLIKVHHGFAFKGEHFQEEESGLVVVTPGNFGIGGGFKSDKLKWYSPEGPIPERYKLEPGTLLVTMTDLSKKADTLGYPAVVPGGDLLYLHNQRIGVVDILRPDLVAAEFLYYAMMSAGYRNRVVATASGSTVHHTSPDRIGEAEISLPEVEVQKRIADILGSLADKIEVNRQMSRTLESMAQALYRQWFVDFGPFQDGAFVESEVGEVPAGWRVGSVLEHCDLLSGGTPKTKTKKYWSGDIPWVSAKDIGDSEVYVTDTERKVTPLGVENSATKILPAHTVVVVARGSVGKFGMMAREMAMNQSCYGLRGKEGVGQPWVYLMLSDLIRHLRQVAYGSVFDSITTSTFKSAKIVLPSQNVLDGFDQEAAPLFAQIHANAMESISLTETQDYLLPKLLSGEVEAAEVAGAA